jgi:hypothetical protein
VLAPEAAPRQVGERAEHGQAHRVLLELLGVHQGERVGRTRRVEAQRAQEGAHGQGALLAFGVPEPGREHLARVGEGEQPRVGDAALGLGGEGGHLFQVAPRLADAQVGREVLQRGGLDGALVGLRRPRPAPVGGLPRSGQLALGRHVAEEERAPAPVPLLEPRGEDLGAPGRVEAEEPTPPPVPFGQRPGRAAHQVGDAIGAEPVRVEEADHERAGRRRRLARLVPRPEHVERLAGAAVRQDLEGAAQEVVSGLDAAREEPAHEVEGDLGRAVRERAERDRQVPAEARVHRPIALEATAQLRGGDRRLPLRHPLPRERTRRFAEDGEGQGDRLARSERQQIDRLPVRTRAAGSEPGLEEGVHRAHPAPPAQPGHEPRPHAPAPRQAECRDRLGIVAGEGHEPRGPGAHGARGILHGPEHVRPVAATAARLEREEARVGRRMAGEAVEQRADGGVVAAERKAEIHHAPGALAVGERLELGEEGFGGHTARLAPLPSALTLEPALP